MNKREKGIGERIFALLMSVIILISVMPFTVVADDEQPETGFSVKVVDSDDASKTIGNAKVTYTIYVKDENDENEDYVPIEGKSDIEAFTNPTTGIAVLDDLAEYKDTPGAGNVKITYTVSAAGYRDSQSVEMEISNFDKEIVVDLTIDKESPSLDKWEISESTPANANGFYDEDFKLEIEASDVGGIKSVKYWVECNGERTTSADEEALYSYEVEEEKINSFTGEVSVDAEKNNGEVKCFVEVEDLAGNKYTNIDNPVTVKVNTVKPSVSVEINGEKQNDYYKERTATITIRERADFFDEENVIINISAKDNKNKNLAVSRVVSSWVNDEAANTHVATVTFTEDAFYEWSISYRSDSTGEEFYGGIVPNAEKTSIDTRGDDVYEFAVDATAPSIELKADGKSWDQLLEELKYGYFKKDEVQIVADAVDKISGVKEVLYYKATTDTLLKEEDLKTAYNDGKFQEETYTVEPEDMFLVYARVEDEAGNVSYISTEGIILDKTPCTITVGPKKDPNVNGIYNENVEIEYSVTDNGSGIRLIEYWVECDGEKGAFVELYKSEDTITSYEPQQFVTSEDGEFTIDALKYSGEEVYVYIKATDNAGNVAEKKSVALDIDAKHPEIEVTYGNDKAVTIADDRGYFGQKRVATVKITERTEHFDGEKAKAGIIIEKDEKEITSDERNKMISEWTTSEGTTPDDAVHELKITYSADAKYTFSISYTDEAGKANEGISYGDSVTPEKFTVDTGKPTGSIIVNDDIWDETNKVNKLTFDFLRDLPVNISATSEDTISPTTIEYWKTDNATLLTEAQLEKQKFQKFEPFDITEDEQMVIYLKITDYAGNSSYIWSNGYIVDTKASKITVKPEAANDNNIHNKDVRMAVSVEEDAPYSGIKSLEYWVTADGKVTQRKTKSFELQNPLQSQLKKDWNDTIVVDSDKNNSSQVVVYIKSTDNAGNINTVSTPLDIDTTAPSIEVSYDNNQANKVVQNHGYFGKKRVASVTITEREGHFDKAEATNSIKITATDAKGKKVTVDAGAMISDWQQIKGTTGDGAKYTAKITFSKDANYQVGISYTDMAGNKNTAVKYGNSTTPTSFTVDRIAPTGSVKAVTKNGKEKEWKALVNTLTFGFWSNQSIAVSGTADDQTSPLESIQYYKSADKNAKKLSDLEKVTDWKKFTKISVSKDEQFVVYLKLTDYAGNVSYISTDGMIVDTTKPKESVVAPKITATPEQTESGIYNDTVDVSIKVEEKVAGNTYSGLKEVRYEVWSLGILTQSETLYSFDKNSPKKNELKKTYSDMIAVDKNLNNSNDVVVKVYAEDNAGNVAEKSIKLKIDITAPVIEIEYDNNNPVNEKYYSEKRVATISVTERNFEPENMKINITNSDGAVPTVSEWSYEKGNGNQDDTKYIATVTYQEDGDYVFSIGYTDCAGNACTEEIYKEGTVNPKEFTIDQTLPEISVSYDNNEVQNGMYFNASRTATITVTEHNFDASNVIFTQTATKNGESISVPTASWSANGDVHTAIITYNEDGDYTFDVAMSDMAGNESGAANYGNSVAAQEFTVDTNISKPTISGVENGKSYKEDVIPVIDFKDINFSASEVQLLRTRQGEKDIDVTEQFIKNLTKNAQGASGTNDTFEKIQDNDGIYTLSVKVTDKAGNEESEKVIFTVNRFGSVYAYSDYLRELQDAYVQKVDNDIVITEYNPNPLVENSATVQVTCDGSPLENVKYEVTPTINESVAVGESGWYQYEYLISADNFSQDGIYKISIASEDSAGNKPETTNYEDGDVVFRVDTTPAAITNIKGLENAIINAESQEVDFTVFDAIGLKKITVYLNDKVVGTFEKLEDLINFSGKIVIGEGTNQKVRFVIEDLAGNITDTAADTYESGYEFVDQITVSTNAFVRWYANKMLFWGTIAGGVAIVGAITGGLLYRRRRVRK